MKLIVCLDDRNGMRFNGRRQSRDRLMQQDLLGYVGGQPLYLSPSSAKLFAGYSQALLEVGEDFLDRAGEADFCFVEDFDCVRLADQVRELVIYRWNRSYPADLYFGLAPAACGLVLTEQTDFPGSSHEKITREVYKR